MTDALPPAILASRGASFTRGGRSIVAPFELSIQPSRLYGLVGANGSGKSTLLRLLARQLQPASGHIEVLGKPAAQYGARAFSRAVAYMPQFTPAVEGMTVRELASLGRFPWHGAMGAFTANDEAKVEAALEAGRLAHLAHRLVDTLSGGERQRAWLAMMLAQDTRCLLLDEPTSALDVSHQIQILTVVRDTCRHNGCAAVIVLHDVNMAAQYCDEIVALRSGEIALRGTPEEVLTPAALASVFGLRMGIFTHPDSGRPVCYAL